MMGGHFVDGRLQSTMICCGGAVEWILLDYFIVPCGCHGGWDQFRAFGVTY